MSCCSGPGIPETVLYLDHYPRAVSAPNGESPGLSTPSKVFLLHRAGVLPISSHEKLNEQLGSLAPEVSVFEASSKAFGVPTSKSDSTSRCGLGLCSALHRNQSVAKSDRAYITQTRRCGGTPFCHQRARFEGHKYSLGLSSNAEERVQYSDSSP